MKLFCVRRPEERVRERERDRGEKELSWGKKKKKKTHGAGASLCCIINHMSIITVEYVGCIFRPLQNQPPPVTPDRLV